MVYPNNQAGVIYSAKSRKAILDTAGENDIPVISDELYGPITYDGNVAPTLAFAANDVTVKHAHEFLMKLEWKIVYVCFYDPIDKFKSENGAKGAVGTDGHETSGIDPILMAATRALREYTNTSMEIGAAMTTKGPTDESKEMVRRLQFRRDSL